MVIPLLRQSASILLPAYATPANSADIGFWSVLVPSVKEKLFLTGVSPNTGNCAMSPIPTVPFRAELATAIRV
jgi:hypothetical protein